MDVKAAVISYLTLNCNYNDSFYNFVLAIALFVPLALTFIFFGISYYTKEIFYFTLSMALALDYFLNFFFTGLFMDPSPNPTCGGSRAYPSFLTQHSFFLYTFLMLSRQFFFLKLQRHDIFFLQAWVLTTWIAAIRLGYNSLEQAVIGAFIGQSFALGMIIVLLTIVYLSKPYAMRYDIVRRLYYVDNIFRLHENKTITKDQLKKIVAQFADEKTQQKKIDDIWKDIE